MRKRRIAVAGLGLLAAAATMIGVAQAEVPAGTLGTLSVEEREATGHDVDTPHYTTSAGCPADADAFNMFIYGPGVFENGLIGITTGDSGLNLHASFVASQGNSFKDIALDNQGTVQVGRYDIVVNCVESFSLEVKGTFTMPLWFTSSTIYQTTDPALNPPTTTATSTATPTSTTTDTGTPTSETSSSDTSTTESSTDTTDFGGGGILPTDTPNGSTPSGGDTSADAQKLASTGVPAGYLALAGVSLLGAGIVIVLATRRRRAAVRSAWPE